MLPDMAVGTWAAMKNVDEKETYKTFLNNEKKDCSLLLFCDIFSAKTRIEKKRTFS